MAEITSSHVLVTNEEVFDGNGIIKADIIPPSVIGTKITISSTPPIDPQVNELWIDSST